MSGTRAVSVSWKRRKHLQLTGPRRSAGEGNYQGFQAQSGRHRPVIKFQMPSTQSTGLPVHLSCSLGSLPCVCPAVSVRVCMLLMCLVRQLLAVIFFPCLGSYGTVGIVLCSRSLGASSISDCLHCVVGLQLVEW